MFRTLFGFVLIVSLLVIGRCDCWGQSGKMVSNTMKITTCEGDRSYFGCGNPDHGIRIVNATYGRLEKQTCSNERNRFDLKSCEMRNVTVIVNKLCYGKNSCSFSVENDIFKSFDTCSNTPKYLSYDVSCEPLHTLAEPECRSSKFQTFVCESETKKLICNDNEKLIIQSAKFGRQNNLDGGVCRLGTSNNNDKYCEPIDLTKEIQEKMCRNNECEIDGRQFPLDDPCPGTFKYIKVEFVCCPRF